MQWTSKCLFEIALNQNGAVNLLSLAVALRNDRNAEVTAEAGETGV